MINLKINGIGRGLSERAQGRALHMVGDFLDFFQILRLAVAVADFIQNFQKALCAYAAGKEGKTMINLKINGIAVSVPEGSTILQAAKLANIRIPTLCYLWSVPNLSSSALYSSASFCNSQFIERTQLKHFFLWVERISSNVVFLDFLTRGVFVRTSIPSETG